MTVFEALSLAHLQGLARIDAQLLLLHTLERTHQDRSWLIANDAFILSNSQTDALQHLMRRRIDGEPVAYLIGHKSFYGLDLVVDARVLDPRDDTETLVDWALDVLNDSNLDQARVLDLGTGSGAIALAIKSKVPSSMVTAADQSSDALDVARQNAHQLNISINFVLSNWFSQLSSKFFDLIVCNPPYIASKDTHLFALRHEPLNALVSGVDGLDDLREICQQAPRHLCAGGVFLVEHGYDQAQAVAQLFEYNGFIRIQSRCDLAGITRCTGGVWQKVK